MPNLFVPQKGQPVCPSKWATHLSLKMGNLFVPQKEQPVCPSKRAICLSLKRATCWYPCTLTCVISPKVKHCAPCLLIDNEPVLTNNWMGDGSKLDRNKCPATSVNVILTIAMNQPKLSSIHPGVIVGWMHTSREGRIKCPGTCLQHGTHQ